MKRKIMISAVLALMLLALAACGKTQSVEQTRQTDAPTEQVSETIPSIDPTTEETPISAATTEETDADAWKTEFEQSLLDNYGVVPDHYEDLGDGIYQVYVEIDGNVIPYVAVDSATGDYHG